MKHVFLFFNILLYFEKRKLLHLQVFISLDCVEVELNVWKGV